MFENVSVNRISEPVPIYVESGSLSSTPTITKILEDQNYQICCAAFENTGTALKKATKEKLGYIELLNEIQINLLINKYQTNCQYAGSSRKSNSKTENVFIISTKYVKS